MSNIAVPVIILMVLLPAGGVMAQNSDCISLTVVYDNVSLEEELTCDWGFSCVITGTEKTILFDTGTNGAILLSNMSTLGIGPGSIEFVFISHEHLDHAGGLWDFLELNANISLFIPASFSPDFKQRARGYGVTLVEVKNQKVMCKGVYTTGELGRSIKEQSLVMRTSDGLVVITGCAHPGIIQILESAGTVSSENIHLALGGFHLLNHSSDEVKAIIREFRSIGVSTVGACHCTGEDAMELFAGEYGNDFINVGVGKRLMLGGIVSE